MMSLYVCTECRPCYTFTQSRNMGGHTLYDSVANVMSVTSTVKQYCNLHTNTKHHLVQKLYSPVYFGKVLKFFTVSCARVCVCVHVYFCIAMRVFVQGWLNLKDRKESLSQSVHPLPIAGLLYSVSVTVLGGSCICVVCDPSQVYGAHAIVTS